MSTITDSRVVSAGEPKPIIPPLASFYSYTRDLSWLVVRLTAGGMLVGHRGIKGMAVGGEGFSATPHAFPPSSNSPPPGRGRERTPLNTSHRQKSHSHLCL